MIGFTGIAFATHDNDGDHITIGKWIDYEVTYANKTVFVIDNFPVIVNNPHVTEIILDWDNLGLPEGEIFLNGVVNGTLGMQIPKNMPRTMNLDFGSSLSTLHSSDLIVELESECFYILEIPLGTDHVVFGSGSVAAGRWEPVIKDNDSCHDIYRDLIRPKVQKHSFAEETSSEYHVGTIQWLKASYPASGTAVVRVIDPDMNLNPEKIDNFDVFVWSDSHAKGLHLTATETGVSTGVFEGTLFLSLEHLGVGHRLKVAEGDTIIAEYDDSTLPASYTEGSLSIIAKSEIRPILESPLKQFKSGIPTDEIQCKDNLVLIQKYDDSPTCVKPETKSKLVERGWTKYKDGITVRFSFCGEGGFDSAGNPNKSNSTHIWDGNYCQWRVTDQSDSMLDDQPEQLKRVLEYCEQKRIGMSTNYTWPDGKKYHLTAVGYEYSNATHIITNNTCEWQKLEQHESAYEDMTSSYMEKIIPTLDDFRHMMSEPYDIDAMFSKFGPPHSDIGSGIHIYVYELNDLTEIWIGYTDHILYVRHIDSEGNLLEELFVENEN